MAFKITAELVSELQSGGSAAAMSEGNASRSEPTSLPEAVPTSFPEAPAEQTQTGCPVCGAGLPPGASGGEYGYRRSPMTCR